MNPAFDISELVAEMTDDELLCAASTARDDLAAAARDEPESEWHQGCFAAVMIYGIAMQERGLSLATKH